MLNLFTNNIIISDNSESELRFFWAKYANEDGILFQQMVSLEHNSLKAQQYLKNIRYMDLYNCNYMDNVILILIRFVVMA